MQLFLSFFNICFCLALPFRCHHYHHCLPFSLFITSTPLPSPVLLPVHNTPQVSSRYIPNKANEAKNCYGTTSIEHPAVSMITTGTYVRTDIALILMNISLSVPIVVGILVSILSIPSVLETHRPCTLQFIIKTHKYPFIESFSV